MSRTGGSDGQARLPARKSLRAKGAIAMVALLAYLLGSVAHVALERARVDQSVRALQLLSQHERALAVAEAAVNAALIEVNETSGAAVVEPAMQAEVALYMETCTQLFATLKPFDPAYAPLYHAIERSHASVKARPVRANWVDLRDTLDGTAHEFERRRGVLSTQRDTLMLGYRQQHDAITTDSLLLALAGIALFGSVVAWFFGRLTGDIRRLERHARQVVSGRRGVALQVNREDELGLLMQAVNRMSADLDERENQIALDAQRRSHQDKMQAVGALAAGISHEVNNPLAVIAATAQELGALKGEVSARRVADSARLILAQTQRAAQAARNLAELAAPQPTENDWIDVNAMVRRALQLMGYDKRYRHIEFDCELAPDVPAVLAPAAAVQQVLMQTLSLGCDALSAVPRNEARVAVGTQAEGASVAVQLRFPVSIRLGGSEAERVLLSGRAIVESLRGKLAFGHDEGHRLCITLTLVADSGSP